MAIADKLEAASMQSDRIPNKYHRYGPYCKANLKHPVVYVNYSSAMNCRNIELNVHAIKFICIMVIINYQQYLSIGKPLVFPCLTCRSDNASSLHQEIWSHNGARIITSTINRLDAPIHF